MHGVPKDLPLQSFQDDQLISIGITQHQLVFRFQGSSFISVEGNWELSNRSGNILDRSMEHSQRIAYRLHILLGQSVCGFIIHPPEFFILHFSAGNDLKIFDDSEQYESFSVNPKDAPGVYI